MRVLAELDGALPVAEFDRHLDFLSEFISGLDRAAAGSPRALSFILRSAESAPAEALIQMLEPLAAARVTARAIVARIEPADALRRFYAALSELSPEANPQELIRWARNGRLLDAHEQAIYGETLCWCGDAMRREPSRRNALSLFSHASPEPVRLGELAFAALWGASQPVPRSRLSDRFQRKPSGSAQDLDEAPLLASISRPNQGWPLLRH